MLQRLSRSAHPLVIACQKTLPQQPERSLCESDGDAPVTRTQASDGDFANPASRKALTAFPAHSRPIHEVVVFSSGGSQGAAISAQGLENAQSEKLDFTLHTRDAAVLLTNSTVRCGDLSLDIARHPRARIATGPLLCDPADTLVIDPTAVAGLPYTIGLTPAGCSVRYSQNGMDNLEKTKRDAKINDGRLISVVLTKRTQGEGTTVLPGGVLYADENDPDIDALHRVFRDRGFFRLSNVPDIHAKQYEKIAMNCALNITATVFGKTLGELLALAQGDPRCERLIGGLAAEVCAVAAAKGVRTKPADLVIADIHALMADFALHPTSMRTAFDAGALTEVGVLNTAVSAFGRRLGVATPLNDLLAEKLASYEALRDAGNGSAGCFHRRHAAMVQRTIAEVLEAA